MFCIDINCDILFLTILPDLHNNPGGVLLIFKMLCHNQPYNLCVICICNLVQCITYDFRYIVSIRLFRWKETLFCNLLPVLLCRAFWHRIVCCYVHLYRSFQYLSFCSCLFQKALYNSVFIKHRIFRCNALHFFEIFIVKCSCPRLSLRLSGHVKSYHVVFLSIFPCRKTKFHLAGNVMPYNKICDGYMAANIFLLHLFICRRCCFTFYCSGFHVIRFCHNISFCLICNL